MSNDKLRIGVLLNASLDAHLIEEGRQLVAKAEEENGSPVMAALAVILATAALEMALEGALKLAEARTKRGGRSVGFRHDVPLAAIGDARTKSLRWKMEHVPSIVTCGEINAGVAVPDLIEPLRQIVECRNQLVHGRGVLTEWEAELSLGDDDRGSVVAGGAAQPPSSDQFLAQKGFALEVELIDGTRVRVPISPPWGVLWLAITADKARAFLDAVSVYIDVCIQKPEGEL